FTEMYRVCKDQATIEARTWDPRHDGSMIDPTHVRAWHHESFLLLERKRCLEGLRSDSRTPLALLWNVDFEVVKASRFIENSVAPGVRAAFGDDADVGRLSRYINNCVSEVAAVLRVRK